MSIRYKFGDNYATYFITFAVVEWIDVFTRNDYRENIVATIALTGGPIGWGVGAVYFIADQAGLFKWGDPVETKK